MTKENIDKMLADSSAALDDEHAKFVKSVKNSLQQYKTETLEKTR